MIKYTTPTLTLRIKNYIFPDNCQVFVTFKQNQQNVTKENLTVTIDGQDTLIEVSLAQEDTKNFKVNTPVQVQVNWITSEGNRNATTIAQISALENLLDRVIEDEDDQT